VKPKVRAPKTSLANRLVWRAHRLKLGWLVKAPLSALHLRDKLRRRAAARSVRREQDDAAAVGQLKTSGWSVVTPFAEASLLQALSAAGTAKVQRAGELAGTQTLTHKSFWTRLLDDDLVEGRFPADNIFVRFAMQPGVVSLIARYFGEMPLLVDVLLTLSRDTSQEPASSQLWHKDYDDRHTVKMFVYLTDVRDSDDGPFTFLPAPASDRLGVTLRSHLSDSKVFGRVERSAAIEMRGPALTTFLCETSRCLHMGSRLAPGHSRLMYTATYVPAPMAYPDYRPKFRATGPVPEHERLLLGL
jgi:hypothetical protein